MPALTNVEAILKYDANAPLVSTRALADFAPHDDEHAAQCMAFEILRGWMSTGMTVAEYDLTTPEFATGMANEAWGRSKLNVVAPGGLLTIHHRNSAQSVGETFFSLGYQNMIDALSQGNRITFTKLGGLL